MATLAETPPGREAQRATPLRIYCRLRQTARRHAREGPSWELFRRALSKPTATDLPVLVAFLKHRRTPGRRDN
eukprot:11225209-Lingulodinium_polyedra.AAC.1